MWWAMTGPSDRVCLRVIGVGTSSNRANDHKAITIETASNAVHLYAVTEAKEIGLTDGSRPMVFVTRKESAVMARAAAKRE